MTHIDTLAQRIERAERIVNSQTGGPSGNPDGQTIVAELRDELRQIRQTYALMLRCFEAGQQDGEVDRIYADLLERATVAYERGQHLRQTGGRAEPPFHCGQDDIGEHFHRVQWGDVWTKTQWEEARAWMIADSTCTASKCLFISALTLALHHLYDHVKVHLLLDACDSDEPSVRRRAMVGIVLVMRRRNMRLNQHPDMRSRLAMAQSEASFRSKIFTVLRLLEQSRLTPTVSRKLGEDILPAIMRGGGVRRMSPPADELNQSLTGQGENIEWFIPVDAQGEAQAKMREMAEMQLGGADVYWTTFSQLRQRMQPFFAQPANCLRPFDPEQPFVQDVLAKCTRQEAGTLIRLVRSTPFCDSDKYAFVYMLDMIGPDGRATLLQSLQGQLDGESLEEALKAASEDARTEEALTRAYVWDLYRYFHTRPVPPRHQGDSADSRSQLTENPFSDQLPHFSPLVQHVFEPLRHDLADMSALAEFFLRNKLYSEALALLGALRQYGAPPTATRWQETGFCQQKLGYNEQAYQSYQEAFNCDPQSGWTLRHLAALADRLGKPLEAEAYCDMLLEDNPDDTQWLKAKARCLQQQQRYADAAALLYKIAYLSPDDNDTWQQLALALALDGQTDKAIEALRPDGGQEWAFVSATVHLARQDYPAAYESLAPLQPTLMAAEERKAFDQRFDEMVKLLGAKRLPMWASSMLHDSLCSPLA